MMLRRLRSSFFFFNDTATTEIYTLSLHDALPISLVTSPQMIVIAINVKPSPGPGPAHVHVTILGGISVPKCPQGSRSEEHTSELQSHLNLVCRLLLEKKNYDRSRPL